MNEQKLKVIAHKNIFKKEVESFFCGVALHL